MMGRRASKAFLGPHALALVAFVLLGTGFVHAQAPLARVLIYKNLTPGRPADSPSPPFSPITSALPAALGFGLVADYPARTLYEGPEASAAPLVQGVKEEGYHAEVTTELDTVLFNDYRIGADTGVAVPPIPPSSLPLTGNEGLYVVALRGYPTPEWLSDLASRNVRLIEALPPSGYLVRGPRGLLETLPTRVNYIRGVFPLTSEMKRVLFRQGMPVTDLKVSVHAVEESPAESLTAHLTALDSNVVAEKENGRAKYLAKLSEVDIETLTAFDVVYSISPVGEPEPSDERQGSLVLAPTIVAGRLELPATAPGYTSILTNKCIPPGVPNRCLNKYDNTKLGLLDSGLDNGQTSGGLVHPDFASSASLQCVGGAFPSCVDTTAHGTLVASVMTGFPPVDTSIPLVNERNDCPGCATNCGGYRWGLGLAPTAPLVVRRRFTCTTDEVTLSNAVAELVSAGANVINYSFNDFAIVGPESQPQCVYNFNSQLLDRRTRQNVVLFTVSAGNAVSGCPSVRAPATAKNAIAAGATRSFTLGWSPHSFDRAETCFWADPSDGTPQDGRNIPGFSPQRASSAYNLLKPDLVAPAIRITGPLSRNAGTCGDAFCHRQLATYLEPNFASPGLRYGYTSGTSFAAPAVAGAAAVLRRWYALVTNNLAANPSPALTKAILINGARNIRGGRIYDRLNATIGTVQHITHDAYQGWGMLNMQRQVVQAPDNNYFFLDQTVTLNTATTAWTTDRTVRDGSKPIRITLVWTDAHGLIGSTYQVRNNLTLVASPFSGCFPCWYGNNIDNSGPNAGMSNTSSTRDSRNNVEQIIIPSGNFGTGALLRVTVVADSLTADGKVPDGPTLQQDFALVVENAY